MQSCMRTCVHVCPHRGVLCSKAMAGNDSSQPAATSENNAVALAETRSGV